MDVRRPVSVEKEAKLIGESGEASYCRDWIDDEGNKTSKVYSTYQRNEVAQLWERPDGTVFVTVRQKTKEESEALRKKEYEYLEKAIKEGRAVRDRIGRVKWIKH